MASTIRLISETVPLISPTNLDEVNILRNQIFHVKINYYSLVVRVVEKKEKKVRDRKKNMYWVTYNTNIYGV